jgi:hypothetical protein
LTGAVALGDAVLGVAVDADLDRRLGDGLAGLVPLDDHAVVLEVDEPLVAADLPAQQQFEARVGGLELEPGVLKVLHAFEHAALHDLVRLDVELLARLGGDVARAGELADDDLPRVTDRFRRHVLVRAASFCTACTCMPPLWAKALLPTYGWPGQRFMFAGLVNEAA